MNGALRRSLLAWGLCLWGAWGGAQTAYPAPDYDYSVLGFNEGEGRLLKRAAYEAVIPLDALRVYRFSSADWTKKEPGGRWVSLKELLALFPHSHADQLLRVYQLPAGRPPGGRAQGQRLLILAQSALVDRGIRLAPSFLTREPGGAVRQWALDQVPGEYFSVLDIRDLDGDGHAEVLVGAAGGKSGFYERMEIVAWGTRGWVTMGAAHASSLHYLDLDGDGRLEIVQRRLVGRRGPASKWTYLDRLHQWDGQQFVEADARYWRYHAQQSLGTLVGEMLDNHEGPRPILEEKLRALGQVRELLGRLKSRPEREAAKKKRFLALNDSEILARYQEFLLEYVADAEILAAILPRLEERGRWEEILEWAPLWISLSPDRPEGWWYLGQAFHNLQERSAAIASLGLSLRLAADREAARGFLRSRRASPGMDSEWQQLIDAQL